MILPVTARGHGDYYSILTYRCFQDGTLITHMKSDSDWRKNVEVTATWSCMARHRNLQQHHGHALMKSKKFHCTVWPTPLGSPKQNSNASGKRASCRTPNVNMIFPVTARGHYEYYSHKGHGSYGSVQNRSIWCPLLYMTSLRQIGHYTWTLQAFPVFWQIIEIRFHTTCTKLAENTTLYRKVPNMTD